jgi:multidrug resistance efflux pump
VKGKAFIVGATIVLTAVVGGALLLLFRHYQSKTAAEVKQQEIAPIATEITVPATLQAQTVVDVPVPVEGKIEAFHAEVGDEVYEGQLLAQIGSQRLQTAEEAATLDLERAQTRVNNLESTIAATRLEASRASADAMRVRADLDRAARYYQRQKILIAEGATPRLTFEKAERDFQTLQKESENLDQLAAQSEERVSSLNRELDATRKALQEKADELEVAKAQIAAGDITSPANGIIAGRRGQAGEDVNPTVKDLFRIATDLTVMEAVAEPGAADFARIKEGQEAFVALAESPDELLPGVIKKVAEGKVTVEFKNPNPAIKPGLTAQVRIKLT